MYSANLLYLLAGVQKKPQLLDFEPHESVLKVGGLQSINYAASKPTVGIIDPVIIGGESSLLAKFKWPISQVLPLRLSSSERSEEGKLCLISPPASTATQFGGIFRDMMKELTGWNLLLLCNMSRFDQRNFLWTKRRGPGLLMLWQSHTESPVKLAARLEDPELGHGKWWYGQGEDYIIHPVENFRHPNRPSLSNSRDETSSEDSQTRINECSGGPLPPQYKALRALRQT